MSKFTFWGCIIYKHLLNNIVGYNYTTTLLMFEGLHVARVYEEAVRSVSYQHLPGDPVSCPLHIH